MRTLGLIELKLQTPNCPFDRLEVGKHRTLDAMQTLLAGCSNRVHTPRALRRVIPCCANKAAFFQTTQQRIDLVRVDRDEVAADRLDALHQSVAVIGLFFDEMEE